MSLLTAHHVLKFRLLADGIIVSENAQLAWREQFGGPLTLAEYATTSGVAVVLPGELYVNAPMVQDGGVPVLRVGDDGFFVIDGDSEIPVDVVPVPTFHTRSQVDRFDGALYPYTNYGVTHTDRVRVSPIEGCAWKCHFCDLPFEFAYRKKRLSSSFGGDVAA